MSIKSFFRRHTPTERIEYDTADISALGHLRARMLTCIGVHRFKWEKPGPEWCLRARYDAGDYFAMRVNQADLVELRDEIDKALEEMAPIYEEGVFHRADPR